MFSVKFLPALLYAAGDCFFLILRNQRIAGKERSVSQCCFLEVSATLSSAFKQF